MKLSTLHRQILLGALHNVPDMAPDAYPCLAYYWGMSEYLRAREQLHREGFLDVYGPAGPGTWQLTDKGLHWAKGLKFPAPKLVVGTPIEVLTRTTPKRNFTTKFGLVGERVPSVSAKTWKYLIVEGFAPNGFKVLPDVIPADNVHVCPVEARVFSARKNLQRG